MTHNQIQEQNPGRGHLVWSRSPVSQEGCTEHNFSRAALKTITGGSCHKYHFCQDKSFVAKNTCLSWQQKKRLLIVMTKECLSRQNFCHDKYIYVTTNICCDKHTFVTQTYVCHDKHVSFVVTKVCLSWQIVVATNTCLSQQIFVATIFVVATNIILLWQKFCRGKHTFVTTKDWDKSFVVTKMILVSAPASNIKLYSENYFSASCRG